MNTSISACNRLHDWEFRLAEAITTHVEIIPDWGISDCLMTCGDVMFAVVGVNPLEKFRNKYTTEQGAAKLMKRNKCDDAESVFEKYLGMTPVNRFAATKGDVGVIIINDQVTAGFFMELGFAVKVPSGLAYFPITEVKQAFKVGVM